MKYFISFDEQDSADLTYGQQREACVEYAAKGPETGEQSLSGDWTPDED